MINFTEKEQRVLDALIGELYAEPGFTDVETQDLVNITKLDPKAVGGLLTSLQHKGVVFLDDGHCIEDLGVLIGLEEEFYHLHPEWKDAV